jgi:succinate dehydrogenase / fumarate reductase cytochrome b subunit
MAWLNAFLSSSIGQKVVVALTGLFLCTFLVVHMVGNLQLIWGTADKFNLYTYAMTHNKVIKVVSYLTYASIVLHAVMAIWVNRRNAGARPVAYANKGKNASWSSRNMVFLGVVLLVYIVVHLYNFWFQLKFGDVGYVIIEGKKYKDLYPVVINAFQIPWLVGLYVAAMLALSYHLVHGFQSGFQTIGVSHHKYTPIIKNIGIWVFGIIIPLGFAAVPVAVMILKDPIPIP